MTIGEISAYRAFLESKIKLSERAGFDVDLEEINPALKDHTRAMVRWALGGGAARRVRLIRFA